MKRMKDAIWISPSVSVGSTAWRSRAPRSPSRPYSLKSRGRKQVERLREEQDEHDPEPEARERDAEERHARGERVPDAVPPHRGEGAERDGDDERQEQRAARQLERRAEPVENQAEDGIARS